MSKINTQRFTVESFKEQATWIAPLLSAINQFVQEVISGFNNGLSVEDNLFAEIKELKFINQPNNFPVRFKTKFRQNPSGLHLVYAVDNTTNAMNFSAAPWVNWSYSNGEIQVNSITGLTASNSYTVRLYVTYK